VKWWNSAAGSRSAPEPRGDRERDQDVEHEIADEVDEDDEDNEGPAAMAEQAFPAEAATLVAQGAEVGEQLHELKGWPDSGLSQGVLPLGANQAGSRLCDSLLAFFPAAPTWEAPLNCWDGCCLTGSSVKSGFYATLWCRE